MTDTVDLSYLGMRVQENGLAVATLTKDVADMRRLFLLVSDKVQRIDRHIAEIRSDVELLVRAEIMGAITNLDTRTEAKLEEHTSRLEGRFDEQTRQFEARFGELDGKMDRLEERMDRFQGRMDRMEERLGGLEQRVDGIDGKLDQVLALLQRN